MAKTNDGKELRKEFELWGWKWETCMESGRPLHPGDPRYYVNQDNVIINNNDSITLTIKREPQTINWYDVGWKTPKINYTPEYACGLIKSIDTVPVNSIIEADLMFPRGANLWPSFWLTACDAWPPEIDIVEGYTNKGGSYKDGLGLHWQWPFLYREYRIETNVHYKGEEKEHLQTGAKCVHPKVLNLPLEENWNRFKCIWTESSIEIYINDKLVRFINDKYILSKMKTDGMWVIFNIWPNKVYKNDSTCEHRFSIKNFKVVNI